MKLIIKSLLLASVISPTICQAQEIDPVLAEMLRLEQEQKESTDSVKDSKPEVVVPTYKHSMSYKAEIGGLIKSGDYLPSYIINNKYGMFSPENSLGYVRAGVKYNYANKDIKVNAEADLVGYICDATPYYDNNFHIQQLYAEFIWKKLGVMAGVKERPSMFVNQELSTGSMVYSNNTRPMPQIWLGTQDYVSITGASKWLNLYFDMSYGKTTDNDFVKANNKLFISEDKYRFYQLLQDNTSFHRKNLFLRTNADKPLVITLGLEHYAQFGGDVYGSFDGGPAVTKHGQSSFSDGAKVFFMGTGSGENEYNHLAAVDGRVDIQGSKWTYSAYTQLYFDEFKHKGLSFRFNGADGLWGIELKKKEKALISEFLFEYLQTTCQNGPVLSDNYTGMSNYYNDQHFGAYAHYGMSCGNPFLVAPIYNTNKDYYPGFSDNLVKAWHIGLKGYMGQNFTYRALVSLRNSWGTPFSQYPEKRNNTAGLIEGAYNIKSWTIAGSVAFDAGDVYGDNWGFGLSLRKCGSIFNK